jgi:type IV pilus assembly protein PilZ
VGQRSGDLERTDHGTPAGGPELWPGAGTGITCGAMPENLQPRAPIELKVDYKKLNSFFADYTKNISKGGTFIKTKKMLPLGTRFRFKLTVPGRPAPFELNGEVVAATASGAEPGMGIRFVWAEDRDRSAFEGIVEKLMSDSLGPMVASKLLRKA